MLKVSVLMLLAMALAMAATTAHARVDLFGRLVTSNNQPHHNHNHEGAQVPADLNVESADAIPYPECIKTCDQCACTLIYPPELSMCICLDSTKTSTSKQLGTLSSSKVNAGGAQVQVIKEKADLRVKSTDLIPYPECIKTCDQCACTLIYPPELSMCICGDSTKISTTKPTKPAEKLPTELVLVTSAVSKSVAEWLPYPECIEKCDECVVCTKIFPIELASCLCGMNVKKAEGRALPK